MFTAVGLLTIFLLETNIYAQENTYYNNGWRPISNEEVLGNLRRNFIKAPEKVHFSASWNPIVRSSENVEQNTNVMPQDINVLLMNEGSYNHNVMDEKQYPSEVEDQDQDLSSNEYSSSLENNNKDKQTSASPRKAKKIMEENLHTNIKCNSSNEKGTEKSNSYESRKNDNITSNDSNKYEVTEISEASEVKDLVEQSERKYIRQYFEPTITATTNESLTNKLFNILGKYNIRTNDGLTNYAASRKKYTQNYFKQNYGYPSSVSYNSNNYFPLDPLLAVFLSNYGYYLPGLYGFPSNYYNIYGYLASNNIHNNKPFGSYKIYSDTDSSH